MNGTEKLLRDAYQSAALTVDPDQVAPRVSLPGQARRRRFAGFAPLAAAAAVTAVIALAVAASRLAGGTGPAPVVSAWPAVPPPYLVVLPLGSQQLAVQKASTRDVTGYFRPPGPTATWRYVVATESPTTFIAAAQSGAQPGCDARLYRLTLTANGRPAGMAALGVPAIPGILEGLAASADGRSIGYATASCPDRQEGPSVSVIGLISPGGGRRWAMPYGTAAASVSLTADGNELAFFVPSPGGSRISGEWILPASSPPGDALVRARKIVSERGAAVSHPAILSPDGSYIYAATSGSNEVTLSEYRVADRKLLRTLHTWKDVPYDLPVLALGGNQLLISGISQGTTHHPVFPTFRVDLATGRVTSFPLISSAGRLALALAW